MEKRCIIVSGGRPGPAPQPQPGGIVGRVVAIADKDDTFVLETGSDRTKIRFRRTAISSVEKLEINKEKEKETPVKK